MRVARLLPLLALAAACASAIPPRFVVERDLGEFVYGRHQRVLEVDLPIPGNPGEAYTGTYFARREGARRLAVATAYVAVHDHAAGLAAEIADALGRLRTYQRTLLRRAGQWMWALAGEEGDRWLLWVSGPYVVKLGQEGREIPDPLLEGYLSPYPSDLGGDGRAREGTRSAGPSARERREAEAEQELPTNLRESTPR